MTTLLQAIESFLSKYDDPARLKRGGENRTLRSYRSDLLGGTGFAALMVDEIKLGDPIEKLTEEMGATYLDRSKNLARRTRDRRAAAIGGLFKYCAGKKWANVSKDRLAFLIETQKLLTGEKAGISFPAEKMERVLSFASKWKPKGKGRERLQGLRSKALILTLYETGLRIHEACNMKLSDINWEEGMAKLIGKGNKPGKVHFGQKSIPALQEYLALRKTYHVGPESKDDPLFARLDNRAKKRILPIEPSSGQAMVHSVVQMALGSDYDPEITAHKWRHAFVTHVYETNDMKMAQVLARHSNLSTTDNYTHLVPGQAAEAHRKAFG